MLLKRVFKLIIRSIKTGLYIQSICFLTTLPILYLWQIPFSSVAFACNIIFGPIMILFIACSLVFLTLGTVLPQFLCNCFSYMVELWLKLMGKVSIESLVIGTPKVLAAWCAAVAIAITVRLLAKKHLKLTLCSLSLGLNLFAMLTRAPSSEHFQLNSKNGNINFYKTKNLVSAKDNGFLTKNNSYVISALIRKELLKNFGSGKLNRLTLNNLSKRVIQNITHLSQMVDLEEVSLEPHIKKSIAQKTIKKFIENLNHCGLTTNSSFKYNKRALLNL